MLPEYCQMALKEWAVTVRALANGTQILLLRKGGIHETDKDFRVIHPEFLLYPTYEHQKEDLLKDNHQADLRQVLEEPRQEDQIKFTHFAKVEETIQVSEQDKVDYLGPHHIWTNEYAVARMRWNPMQPLSILLLRVYHLENPVDVPYLPEYGGCTSWVDIFERVALGQLKPVLTDEEFGRQVDAIKGCLGEPVATT